MAPGFYSFLFKIVVGKKSLQKRNENFKRKHKVDSYLVIKVFLTKNNI